MAELKNRAEIISELAEILKNCERYSSSFQTDIYIYYDEDEQTAELYEFENPGGSSWLNDDHYTIYIDKPHDVGDYYSAVYMDIKSLADAVEIPFDELLQRVAAEYDEDIDDVEYYEVSNFIDSDPELLKKLCANYEQYLNDNCDFEGEAADLIDEWLETIEE